MSPVLALYNDLIKVLLAKFMTKLYDNLKFSYYIKSNQTLSKPESCTCTNRWLNLIKPWVNQNHVHVQTDD
jgi:hypothetical protein